MSPGGGRVVDSPRRTSVRVALLVVGLAAATYGIASLTGGWLGTPPWWESTSTTTKAAGFDRRGADPGDVVPWSETIIILSGFEPPDAPITNHFIPDPTDPAIPTNATSWGQPTVAEGEPERGVDASHLEPRDGREWISGGLVAAGLALAAFGAWPQRRTGAAR